MKKYFLTIVVSLLLLSGAAIIANAQILPEKKLPIPFPVIPFIVEYEYAPYYFSQDIYEHPQYSLIEAIFEPSEPASLQLVLTEKGTRKRTFYCNSEARVKMRSLEGKEAVLSKIDFKTAPPSDELPTYDFAFRDKQGQPILWRVIPTSRPSERGVGLTPMAAATSLRLEYRDNIGTTVGEGTIVKIGDKLFEAVPWAETSSPPYFYAYHGSFTVGRHIGAFPLGIEKWQVTASPNELKEGAEWIFTGERGRRRIFRITANNKDELTIGETNGQDTESTLISFVIRNTPQGFAMRSLQLKNRGRQMQVLFTPELPLYLAVSGKIEVAFVISQGKADKIASGTIIVERIEDKLRLRWQMKSPDWAKSRVLDGLIKFAPDGYQIETTQTAK
ncbi:MAG: hypothetical protein M3367_18805 [Acidobacteriota bacterium]|nr:hypothetical protein [Acidobacteriota bacterium]